MSQQENLQRLNELMAEELEAGLRYFHLAATVRGMDRLLVKDILLENMKETFDHARMIAEKILQLGEVPTVDIKIKLAPEKTNAQEALRTAVTVERAALDAYRELLEKVEGEGDIVLEEFARAQIALESEHVSELELLLED
ncbi:MAG: ferritin-like domain-containing protein [Planctomycetota bacterium]